MKVTENSCFRLNCHSISLISLNPHSHDNFKSYKIFKEGGVF